MAHWSTILCSDYGKSHNAGKWVSVTLFIGVLVQDENENRKKSNTEFKLFFFSFDEKKKRCIIGWFSPALPKLLSDDTPLETGPLSSVQVSWVGSITNIGALCGSLTFGFFTTVLGCKRAMVFLAIPSILYWILIHFGTAYYHLLLARFFTGWTNGGRLHITHNTFFFSIDWVFREE